MENWGKNIIDNTFYNFKFLRKKSNKTIDMIASELNISVGSYRKYECSSRLPSAKTIISMINAYNCSADEMIKALKFHLIANKYKF